MFAYVRIYLREFPSFRTDQRFVCNSDLRDTTLREALHRL